MADPNVVVAEAMRLIINNGLFSYENDMIKHIVASVDAP